jgi:predicted DNA-binding transcriptional regulator YafY
LSKSVRLLELTNLLSAREVRLDEIVRRFGISERTAYRDLADLGYSHIPITGGGRAKGIGDAGK